MPTVKTAQYALPPDLALKFYFLFYDQHNNHHSKTRSFKQGSQEFYVSVCMKVGYPSYAKNCQIVL